MISVAILTLNEEVNISGCLESVEWSDDIVVLDSFSNDRTVEIANGCGARVYQRKFDNYASQRNAALNDVKYKYPWVLLVDADERWEKSIYKEIETALNHNSDITLYHFRRKDMFMGRWLKRSSGYPTWFGRLVKLGAVIVQREINEEYMTNGEKGYLKSHFIHYPFNKGVSLWIERHNRYSSMEAEVLIQGTQNKIPIRDFFSSDPIKRRKFLKQLAYRIPFRPFLTFCYLFILRLGFLDMGPGFTYCRLRAMYEYMIDLKARELKRCGKGLPL